MQSLLSMLSHSQVLSCSLASASYCSSHPNAFSTGPQACCLWLHTLWRRELPTILSSFLGLLSHGALLWDSLPLGSICYRIVQLSQQQRFSTPRTLPGLCCTI